LREKEKALEFHLGGITAPLPVACNDVVTGKQNENGSRQLAISPDGWDSSLYLR
jgi:hypothetical protein